MSLSVRPATKVPGPGGLDLPRETAHLGHAGRF